MPLLREPRTATCREPDDPNGDDGAWQGLRPQGPLRRGLQRQGLRLQRRERRLRRRELPRLRKRLSWACDDDATCSWT